MKKIFFSFLNILLLLLFSGFNKIEKNQSNFQKIWYKNPAKKWVEALPIGNGRIGAMIFGDPINDKIQLNDDSLWPYHDNWQEPPGRKKDLKKIRKLLLQGDAKTSDSLIVEKFSNKSITLSHQTLGNIFLNWDHKNITDYQRSLNLATAISNISYKSDGYKVEQKAFASNPHQLIILQISSEHPKGLNGEVILDRPKDNNIPTVKTIYGDNFIKMSGEVTQYKGKFREKPVSINSGVKFETILECINESGHIIKKDKKLLISNVKKLTIFISSNSDFYTKNFREKNLKELSYVKKFSFEDIKNKHIKDFQSFYNRINFSLDYDNDLDLIPTDQRLQNFKNGILDNGLIKILYDYGRYLLISSSRKGTLPANLQGLWNNHIAAPWNADYHLNINLQMNYWLANQSGLHELNYPLFDYVDRLIENGKKTAKINYGIKGSVIPHASDIWAKTWLRAREAYWGSSFGAGGWLMQHYWNHFKFTNDNEFLLERALPAVKQIAEFYSNWLIIDPRDNLLISAPSTSPENQYYNSNGDKVSTCLGSAKDQQIIFEVFTNYLKICEYLNIKNRLAKRIKKQLKKLRPGFVIGKDGRILEWDREYREVEPGHRHMSHLYGFHPGNQVSIDKNPEIFNAVKKTIDYRIMNGSGHTGWSRAWLINISARLLDSEMAYENIEKLVKSSLYDNLFDSHPPFQIDGNFGFTSGINEMLIQSHEEVGIRILPSLPKKWSDGKIEGIVTQGNIKFDIEWKNNKLYKISILSPKNKKIKAIHNDKILTFDLKKNQIYSKEF